MVVELLVDYLSSRRYNDTMSYTLNGSYFRHLRWTTPDGKRRQSFALVDHLRSEASMYLGTQHSRILLIHRKSTPTVRGFGREFHRNGDMTVKSGTMVTISPAYEDKTGRLHIGILGLSDT